MRRCLSRTNLKMFGLALLCVAFSLVSEARPTLKDDSTFYGEFIGEIRCIFNSFVRFTHSYSLVRAVPTTQSQVDFLRRLRYKKDNHLIAFWRSADKPGRHVDIWVYGQSKRFFVTLNEKKIAYKMRLQNLTTSNQLVNVSMKNIEHYDSMYHSLTEVNSELKRLSMAYSELMSLITLGKSYEGREIYAIKIKEESTRKKPLMFINCGIHGREWLSISSCLGLLRRLAFNKEYDQDLNFITKNFEVVMAPVLNPDGYHFTRTMNRFWRKSRSPTRESNCPGVDLNRNFNFRWGGRGSSPDSCEETYSGQRPFSERECLALARYLYSRRSDLKAFLDVHTFGQLLMYPWGFTRQDSFHSEKQRALLKKISQRISVATGSIYKYGPASSVLYETSGDSTDWVYGYLGVVHSYGIELRPRMQGRGTLLGFKHPASDIVPSAGELFIVVREMLRYLDREPNMKRSI